jgi:MFS family permease
MRRRPAKWTLFPLPSRVQPRRARRIEPSHPARRTDAPHRGADHAPVSHDAVDDQPTFRALRHRNYRLFFTGQGLSVIGTWLQQVAMSWLVYRLTGSAGLLGVVAFCANVGILLFGNLAGVVADRIDRRRGLLLTQSLMLVQAVVLAVLVAFHWIETWHLIVLALWLGTCSAFDLPLRQSMYVHFIADRGDLANAIALNSMLVNTARVVGPAIAGLLLALTSEAVCFALNALSFLAVIVAILRMHWPADIRPATSSGWWASWVEGVRYAHGPQAGSRAARDGGGTRVDDRPVFVTDAGVRQGHLRRRAAHARMAAVRGRFRRAGRRRRISRAGQRCAASGA